MSTTMFETERWQLIDHYLSMIQDLNAQARVMHTSQNEAYEKLIDLIQSIRTPEIPRRNHTVPHLVNQPTYRSNRRMNNPNIPNIPNTPRPLRRRVHEPSNTRQGEPTTTTRSPSRRTQPRSQTEPLSSTSSPNVNGDQDEGHRSRVLRTDASSEIRPPLNVRPPTEIESAFHTIQFTGDNNSSPFANIIHAGVQLSQQQIHERVTPFNFFNNVPVFPTPEEITDATRIISFDNIEEPLNDQCPITMCPFNPSDIVTQIVHCGHIFDIVHLNGWFRTNVRCPVCRHDIRDIGVVDMGVNDDDVNDDDVNDDNLSTLVPENFVDYGYESDPDMPPLEPAEATQHTASVPNAPASSEPINTPNMDVHTLPGTIGSINISPIWGFRQSSDTSSHQFISDIQNTITTQGLNLLANAINQSIEGSFPPPSTPVPVPVPVPVPDPEPNPDNEHNESRH